MWPASFSAARDSACEEFALETRMPRTTWKEEEGRRKEVYLELEDFSAELRKPSFQNISILIIDRWMMGTPYIQAVASFLGDSHLSKLSLSGNFIGRSGSRALAEALVRNDSLRSLNVSCNGASSDDLVEYLGQVLPTHPLEELDFQGNFLQENRSLQIFLGSNIEFLNLGECWTHTPISTAEGRRLFLEKTALELSNRAGQMSIGQLGVSYVPNFRSGDDKRFFDAALQCGIHTITTSTGDLFRQDSGSFIAMLEASRAS